MIISSDIITRKFYQILGVKFWKFLLSLSLSLSLSEAAAALLLLSAANPAIADEQIKQSVNLGEVEVTANKISENLKDVPQSISVVSDTELQEREVKNVEELVKTMPNITGVAGCTRASVLEGSILRYIRVLTPLRSMSAAWHKATKTQPISPLQILITSRFCEVLAVRSTAKTQSAASSISF